MLKRIARAIGEQAPPRKNVILLLLFLTLRKNCACSRRASSSLENAVTTLALS